MTEQRLPDDDDADVPDVRNDPVTDEPVDDTPDADAKDDTEPGTPDTED